MFKIWNDAFTGFKSLRAHLALTPQDKHPFFLCKLDRCGTFFVRDKYRQPVHTHTLNSSYPASLHLYPEPGLLSDTSSLLLPPRRRGYYRTNAPSSLVLLPCNPPRETLSRLVLQPLPWFIRQVLWMTIVQAVPGSARASVFGSDALKSGGYCRSMIK